jgi:hypothetical protein
MMTDDLLSPADLFRYYRRGMLDQDSLVNQILLRLIELAETQQAHSVLLEMIGEELSGLGLDVALIADMLRLVRPSQAGRDEVKPDEERTEAESTQDSSAAEADE